ncbi:MAG: hypothetical protein QOD52_899 [Gaiellaceae bacterium]|jgi:hypothetical protein|nr:hypothetical protein [Gaiellaceae bacterium]
MLVALALVGCGASKPSAQARANMALLDQAPAYPGVTAPKTTPGDAFAARDWKLPAAARAAQVIDWYIATLQARGWKVTGKSFDTIRATHGRSSLSVGVRARRLEVVAST